MSKNTEGDVAADLAAIREDVARLAETISKLLQHQTEPPALASPRPWETREKRSRIQPARRAI